MSSEVLLIDDDAHYRRTIKLQFRDKPYQFFEASSPAEGIAMLDANPQIRVIVLDLQYAGGGRGTDVLEHIKERLTAYRVIVLTAHDDLLPSELAGEYAVFNYLPKTPRSPIQAIRFSVEQAFRDLERLELEQKSLLLLDVQRRISGNEPLSQTLDFLCQAVRSMVDGYTCHIRVYDFTHGDYRLEGFAGPDTNMRRLFDKRRAKGEFFSGRVAASGSAEFFSDLQALQGFREFAAASLREREHSPAEALYWRAVSSAYIVPITTGLFGNVVDAVLNVTSQSPNFFVHEKRTLVDEFVTQAGLAVTKDWLQRRRKEIHHDYSRIGGMLSAISELLEGDDVLQKIHEVVTRSISEIINPEIVSIFLYNEETRLVENVAELRGNTLVAPNEFYHPGQNLTGAIFTSGKTCHLPAPESLNTGGPLDDHRFDHENATRELRNIPSGKLVHFLGVPIRIGSQVIGALRAVNKKSAYYDASPEHTAGLALLDRGFSVDDRNVMEIAAGHLAVAIRNAQLLRDKKRQVDQLGTIGDVGRLINSALDINDVLETTIHKLADVMQAEVCMLFLKSEDGRKIVLKELFGFPETLLENAHYDIGEGVTGRVAATGLPILIQRQVAGSGKYDAQIRDFLTQKHGQPRNVESLMVVPITAKGTVLGAMKVINKVDGYPVYTENDLELFGIFAAYVGVAIENAQIYRITHDELVIHKRNAALSSLVSAVAHEINNTSGLIPANVAGIRAQLKAPNDSIDRRLALIERVANQATDFATQIAGFATARQGDKQLMDVNEIVRSAIADLQDLPKYRNSSTFRIEIATSSEPLVCAIFANPFTQIVRNIVINAWQALEDSPDGLLRITTFVGSGDLAGAAVLRFQDNGPGIRKEHIARIFDPDFTTKPTGSGVGLWLVRTQLEQIGGQIAVQSEPGRGAAFVISVPLAADGEVA